MYHHGNDNIEVPAVLQVGMAAVQIAQLLDVREGDI